MRRICVFCGLSSGTRPEYAAAAVELGTLFAERGIGLVYGGATVGLMGTVADATLRAGGEAHGVIPDGLFPTELPHTSLTDQHIVGSMHERKALMAELSEGFIALPGGSGTIEEIYEAFTWNQLGIHSKATVLLNTLGYYDALVDWMDHAVDEGFLRAQHRDTMLLASTPVEALAAIDGFVPLEKSKWVDVPKP